MYHNNRRHSMEQFIRYRQEYQYPPNDYDGFNVDNHYGTLNRRSSFSKHSQDNNRSKRHDSYEGQTKNYDPNRDYYYEVQRLQEQLNQQKSIRDTQNGLFRPHLYQHTTYVNDPMMAGGPMMNQPQGLDVCITDPNNPLMIPPMIQQPYFFLPPLSTNIPAFPMVSGLSNNNNIPNNNIPNINVPSSDFPNINFPDNNFSENNVQDDAKERGSNGTNDSTSNRTVNNHAPPEPINSGSNNVERHVGAIQPRALQRRRSMIDTILSAFALPNKYDIVRPHSTFASLEQPVNEAAVRQLITQSDISSSNDSRPSSTSSDFKSPPFDEKVQIHVNMGDERFTKLHQDIKALQNQQHIWCYKSPSDLWVAFDVKNQDKIDSQYVKSKANGSSDNVLVLTKQRNVPCPLYISVKALKAWYHAPRPIVFDMTCFPSENVHFIISNETRKRPKSTDITKLFNGIFKT